MVDGRRARARRPGTLTLTGLAPAPARRLGGVRRRRASSCRSGRSTCVAFLFASTFPFSVTVVCVTLAAAPVVTAGLAALAAAGASSASASANNMAPRNMIPPVDEFAPIHEPTTRREARTSRRRERTSAAHPGSLRSALRHPCRSQSLTPCPGIAPVPDAAPAAACPSIAGRSAAPRPSGCCGAPASARGAARPSGSRSSASTGAVHALTHPRSRRLNGPAPKVDGRGLAPLDVWGHDVLWWLDRMVRTEAPLVERMTLVWHDWFATSKATVDGRWMLRQNAPAAPPRARQLPHAGPRHHQGPGDADLAQRHRPTTAGSRTRTTRASCRSCSRSAPAAATPRATCARWRAR